MGLCFCKSGIQVRGIPAAPGGHREAEAVLMREHGVVPSRGLCHSVLGGSVNGTVSRLNANTALDIFLFLLCFACLFLIFGSHTLQVEISVSIRTGS